MKWRGEIGFSEITKVRPGVYLPTITSRIYRGDVNTHPVWRNQYSSDSVNDDVNMSMTISVVADPYAVQNLGYMKYITYNGSKWRISSVEPRFPRLVISIGGLYNDSTGDSD